MSLFEKPPVELFDRPPADSELNNEYNEASSGEFHNSNLYDQDEDASGEKVDLATGEAIDNSGEPEESFELPEVSAEDIKKSDKEMKGDAADQWLRDNDPDYQG